MLTLKKVFLIFIALFSMTMHAGFATPTASSHPKKVVKQTHPKKHAAAKRKAKKAPAKKTHAPQIRSEEEVENALLEHHADNKTKSPSFVSSIAGRIVSFVEKSVETLRYSAYKLGGTKFDASKGIYVVDCSSYVDNILRSVHPNAFFSLVNSSGADKPNSQHYYEFFSALAEQGPHRYWDKVDEIEALRPGDILVFRYKNTRGLETGGHVMVVMDKPVRTAEAYLVSVADSAPAGHSQDTRPRHNSGIGIGTLLLKMDPRTGQPSAYAWKVGSRWNKNVNFAMARPIDLQLERRRSWL